jgi:hypothetical protein
LINNAKVRLLFQITKRKAPCGALFLRKVIIHRYSDIYLFVSWPYP